MSGPTAEALTETINSALTRAADLATDGRWLHQLAYGLQGRDPDRPSRARPPTDPANPDNVRGRTHDLGVGDDGARHAYTWAGQLLGNAHRLAGETIAAHRVRLGLDATEQRAAVLPWRTVRGDLFAQLLTHTAARLRWLRDHGIDRADDDTRRRAWAAANYLIAADVEVKRILPTEPRAKRQCVNCGGVARKGGRECAACASARLRAEQAIEKKAARKKARKPKRSAPVAPRNAVAFAARDRRRARGEDYGEAPLPWGGYRDGEWTPATEHPEAS